MLSSFVSAHVGDLFVLRVCTLLEAEDISIGVLEVCTTNTNYYRSLVPKYVGCSIVVVLVVRTTCHTEKEIVETDSSETQNHCKQNLI